MTEQNRDAAAEDFFDKEFDKEFADGWEDGFEEFEDEEMFESYPPELLARSMSDALERLKDFDPFAI